MLEIGKEFLNQDVGVLGVSPNPLISVSCTPPPPHFGVVSSKYSGFMVTLESLIWNSCIWGDTVGGCLSHVCSGSQQSEVTMQVDCLSSRNLGGRVHGAHKPDVRHW